MFQFIGKPVAVTHSRGKGGRPEPGSDSEFERKEWEKRGRVDGPAAKADTTSLGNQGIDLAFHHSYAIKKIIN